MNVGRWRVRVGRDWVLPALIGAVIMVAVSAGAVAAIETDTVTSIWVGLWWAISLITTVGFIGHPPTTAGGAILSAVLMVVGFLLLAMVSAFLASMFVREEELPREARQESADEAILDGLRDVQARLAQIEAHLAEASGQWGVSAHPDGTDRPSPSA
jgi:hypothetical protein